MTASVSTRAAGGAGERGSRHAPSPAAAPGTATPVTLVISSLGAGGAERVLSSMAAWWVSHGRPVNLVTLAPADAEPFYDLAPGVRRFGLGLLAESTGAVDAVAGNLTRMRRLRAALAALDGAAVVSFGTETNCLVIAAGIGLGQRTIVAERCDPRFVPASRAWRLARSACYPLAAEVVVQSRDAAAFFTAPVRPVVVPNPVRVERAAVAHAAAAPGDGGPFVAAMGRLTAQKGFDLLIRAFARLAARHPGWSLRILGEGPDRDALAALARAEGVAGRVALPGLTRTPLDVLRRAELFVLSSRFEGFPNALCEAMACGLPVVAADCPSGPRDIVRDGLDGYLVRSGDVDALAHAMDRLMGSPRRRRAMGRRAAEIGQRFGIDDVMARWSALVDGPGRRDRGVA